MRQRGNVKALHAVKDPLTLYNASRHESKSMEMSKTKQTRRQGHFLNELYFVFPAFERLQMARCSAREEQGDTKELLQSHKASFARHAALPREDAPGLVDRPFEKT